MWGKTENLKKDGKKKPKKDGDPVGEFLKTLKSRRQENIHVGVPSSKQTP